MKTLIFGAGIIGRRTLEEIKQETDVIGFIDNDSDKWNTNVDQVCVLGGQELLKALEFDEIIIASALSYNEIREQLLNLGISENKIKKCNAGIVASEARKQFLKEYAFLNNKYFEENEVAVAEGGVFKGVFAKHINKCFPNLKLYLFDTFEGFDERDINIETYSDYSESKQGEYSYSAVEKILDGMVSKENIIIRKGFFPETTRGIENEIFGFVNLDFDLYKPMYEGLNYFYPRMINGGVILLHDYFSESFSGVRMAVEDFEKNTHVTIKKIPIGDGFSVAIIK